MKIIKSLWRISLATLMVVLAIGYLRMPGTNSFFSAELITHENQFSSGYWIPGLEMKVDPEDSDGEDGWYKTKPCVSLTSLITDENDTKIYYRLESEEFEEYSGDCVEIPNGEWNFEAYGEYDGKSNWRSETVKRKFKVNTYSVEPGDVVINEIMWMGSFESKNDEWVELRNMTDEDIDLKNWNIYGAVSGSEGHLEIAGGADDDYIISAHGFYLISKFEKNKSSIDVAPNLVKGSLSFSDNYRKNGAVILKDKEGNVVDSTPLPSSSHWPKGRHGIIVPWGLLHLSMERNNNADKWHTCNPLEMTRKEKETMRSYWDKGTARFLNCGTPGHKNLSRNDPNDDDFEKFFSEESDDSSPEIDEKSPEDESGNNPAADIPAPTDETEEILPAEETIIETEDTPSKSLDY